MAGAKTEFEQSETPKLTFEPFINPTLSGRAARILTLDVITCTYVAPNAATGTITLTRDATTGIWQGDFSVAAPAISFQAGQWLIWARSNDASAPDDQWRVIYWGVGIHADIPAIKTATDTIAAVKTKTDNLPSDPADASDVAAGIAAATAAIEGVGAHTILSLYDRLGTPVGASLSADVAAVKAATDVAVTQATLARKVGTNRDKIVGTQLVLYDDDNTTPLRTWNLFDDGDVPSSTRIFERVPV